MPLNKKTKPLEISWPHLFIKVSIFVFTINTDSNKFVIYYFRFPDLVIGIASQKLMDFVSYIFGLLIS